MPTAKKKPRSAAQKAATRKMIAANKAARRLLSRSNVSKVRKAPRSAAQKAATRKMIAANKARARRNPEVECREPRKYFDRYRNAQVMHGGEFVQLEGCWTGSRYVGRAEGAKKRTTISKKVVRQKAFRTPSRVKGVRVRRRK